MKYVQFEFFSSQFRLQAAFPASSRHHLYELCDKSTCNWNVFVWRRPRPLPFLNLSQYPPMTNAMSQTPTATSNYQVIFHNALEAYKKTTKKELRSHPLLPKLQACNSPDAVLTVLREQIPEFDQSHSTSGTNDKLTNWLNPTVNVLYSFSEAIGTGVGLVSNKSVRGGTVQGLIFVVVQVYPPAGLVFTGIGVLLSVGLFLVPLPLVRHRSL